MGDILVGTASWTHRTLITSGWYPPAARTPETRLRHYATQFPLVEVDATYYALPSEQTVRAWRDRTPDGFTFNIKAFALLTGHPTRPSALPRDLRAEVPDRRLYPKDVPDKILDELWHRFLAALAVLDDANRLGAVLFQFPPWFTANAKSRARIREIQKRCAPLRICVEFRHQSWLAPEHQDETLDFLAAHDIPYVVVDMPQGHTSSVPPLTAATSDLAVVRFHGHSKEWTSGDLDRRFTYFYEDDELKTWATRIRALAEQATTHVIFNNCCADHAQRNAARLKTLLS
jgi:uncharacterized protein YecE (DUF72 family)